MGLRKLGDALGPVVLLALALEFAGCADPPPPPPPAVKKQGLSPEQRTHIEDLVTYLNNENIRERYREELIELSKNEEEARRYVVPRLVEEVKRGRESSGRAPGSLRGPGRRRAVEVLDAVGTNDDAGVRDTFVAGLRDDAEVRAASAAALAKRGSEEALDSLLGVLADAKVDAVARAKALEAIALFAKPERKGKLLDALDATNRKDLGAVVVKGCLPQDAGARAKELREVARGHKNLHARAFALLWLADARDAEARALAWSFLDDGNASLRGPALDVLAGLPPAEAAVELGKVLAKDPKDAEAIAKVLFRTNASEVVDVASQLFDDASRAPETRAVVAREVLGRLRDDKVSSALRGDALRERALPALRRGSKDRSDVVGRAAIDAIARIGTDSDVDALATVLSEPGFDRSNEVVRAFGALGGAFAANKLVELLATDPKLRPAATDALAAFRDKELFPWPDLIALLTSESQEIRAAAIAALRSANGGDSLAYDPAGAPAEREQGLRRWRAFWSARRKGG